MSKPPGAHLWSEEQLKFLSKNFIYMDNAELSESLNRTVRSVREMIRKLKLYRCKKLSDEDLELIEALYVSGMSYKTIGEKFEVTANQVRRTMENPYFICGVCGSFSASTRNVYWQFNGEPQQIYSCCAQCCKEIVKSFNEGNDSAINSRRRVFKTVKISASA